MFSAFHSSPTQRLLMPHRSLSCGRVFKKQSAFVNCRPWSSVTANDSSITIHSLNATYPYIWLRDSCQSPDCVHPSSSQKLHRTSDISPHIRPSVDGIQLADKGIHIEWTDGHKSFYPVSFLERHSSPSRLSAFHKDVSQLAWDAPTIGKVPHLFLPYKSLRTPSGLLAAITQLSQYGLLFVSKVPNAETSYDTCELRTLADHFGEIRHTFYGQVWDVKNVRDSRNIAYTNLDLGLHMDLLYFQHPPRYQILHCLRNQVLGGTSIFVDALHAADNLRATHHSDFDVLASTPVAFHYINDGHHLHYEHRTIELSDDSSSSTEQEINHINYSPPFQAPLLLSTPPVFYTALKRFAELLNDPLRTYQYTLREGDAVLFDNRRVLHARTAFSDIEGKGGKGETNRWLKGCYLEADALLDRGRALRSKADLGLL